MALCRPLRTMTLIRLANLSLLVLFPIAWAAPLLRAGLLPLFSLADISVISGVASLWEKDMFLALVVITFAMIAPVAKVVVTEGILTDRLPARVKPWLFHLGRLAMADVFLIAIYITVAKGLDIGLGMGRIEVGWGLYLFTFCVLVSLGLGIFTAKKT